MVTPKWENCSARSILKRKEVINPSEFQHVVRVQGIIKVKKKCVASIKVDAKRTTWCET